MYIAFTLTRVFPLQYVRTGGEDKNIFVLPPGQSLERAHPFPVGFLPCPCPPCRIACWRISNKCVGSRHATEVGYVSSARIHAGFPTSISHQGLARVLGCWAPGLDRAGPPCRCSSPVVCCSYQVKPDRRVQASIPRLN